MMRYRVLWIDDEYPAQADFIGEAEQEGIDIEAFMSQEEGMTELERNLHDYHAVILDAKVKNNKNDTVTSLAGLAASRDRLKEINRTTYLPFFIFTGQPDYLTSDVFRESYGKYYVKARDNDALFRDLKDAIEKKEEFRLHKKYHRAFAVCTNKYLGLETSQFLTDTLRRLEKEDEVQISAAAFNDARKVLEKLLTAFHKYGVVPDEIATGSGWINRSAKFLYSGKGTNYKLNVELLPPVIAHTLQNLLPVLQDASHVDGELKLNVVAYVGEINSPYLFKGSVNQLLELLIWFKELADTRPNVTENRKLWTKIELDIPKENWTIGTVTRIAQNDYGTFQPDSGDSTITILPHKVKELRLQQGSRIEVVTKYDGNRGKDIIEHIRRVEADKDN